MGHGGFGKCFCGTYDQYSRLTTSSILTKEMFPNNPERSTEIK